MLTFLVSISIFLYFYSTLATPRVQIAEDNPYMNNQSSPADTYIPTIHKIVLGIHLIQIILQLAVMICRVKTAYIKVNYEAKSSFFECYRKSTARLYGLNRRSMKYFLWIITIISSCLCLLFIIRIFKWKGYDYLLAVSCMVNCSLLKAISAHKHRFGFCDKFVVFSLQIFKYFNLIMVTILTGIAVHEPIVHSYALASCWLYFLIRSNDTLQKNGFLFLMLLLDSIGLFTLFGFCLLRVRTEQGLNWQVLLFMVQIVLWTLRTLYLFGKMHCSMEEQILEDQKRLSDLQIYIKLNKLKYIHLGTNQTSMTLKQKKQNPQQNSQRNLQKQEKSIQMPRANQQCPICIQNFNKQEVIRLTCNHCYHLDCIEEWIFSAEEDSQCPMCRSAINLSVI